MHTIDVGVAIGAQRYASGAESAGATQEQTLEAVACK